MTLEEKKFYTRGKRLSTALAKAWSAYIAHQHQLGVSDKRLGPLTNSLAQRAIKVAAVATCPLVAVGFDEELGAVRCFCTKLNVPVFFEQTCPCGGFTHPRRSCTCSGTELERHYKRLEKLPKLSVCFPLDWRIPEHLVRQLHPDSAPVSPVDDAKRQIESAMGREVKVSTTPDTAKLLTALEREYGLGEGRLTFVKHLAKSIARLDASDVTTIVHWSEAAQYVANYYRIIINRGGTLR